MNSFLVCVRRRIKNSILIGNEWLQQACLGLDLLDQLVISGNYPLPHGFTWLKNVKFTSF